MMRSGEISSPVKMWLRILKNVASRPKGWRQLAGIAIVLIIGQIITSSGITDSQYVPRVSTVLHRIFQLCSNTNFLSETWDTIEAWLIGLILSTLFGTMIGIVVGINIFVYRSFQSLFDFVRPIPSVALIPLGMLVIGQGLQLKLALIVYAASWPMLYNVVAAIRTIDRTQRETAEIFRIGRFDQFVHVLLPSALPYLATGIRIASPIALVLSISVEMLGGSRAGLGIWILDANSGAGRADLVFAGTAIAGILGVTSNWVLAAAERRLLHWHTPYRARNIQ